MRIAIVHSYYRSQFPSGENTCVDAQFGALAEAGHTVALLSRHTDSERTLTAYPARAAVRVITGRGPDPTSRLAEFRPDVVHIHNQFPNIGTNWVDRWPGPIVHTLHNFRPLCANGLLFRDGSTCTACPDGSPLSAVVHRCYQDSAVASIPLTVRNSRGISHDRLLARSDALLVLSELARDIFGRYGLAAEKMRIVPNGLAEFGGPRDGAPIGPRWLSVGRLSAEKGFKELAEIWPSDIRLDIYGDGPERDSIAAIAPPSVQLRGLMGRTELRQRMSGYTGLIFPSRWFEMSPYTVIEALEAGLPVVALEGSSGAETVRQKRVGDIYRDRESLVTAMNSVVGQGLALRRHCLDTYEKEFSIDAWVRALESVYEEARDKRGTGISTS